MLSKILCDFCATQALKIPLRCRSLLSVGLLSLFASLFLSEFEVAKADEPRRPNVLFIAVDDLRPELGCYGGRGNTPNLDQLAESGLVFDRAYCNQAVCGASRVSLMTGLYPEYTGERTYHVTDWRKRWPEVTTLNQHFQDNGYATVGLGKIYHGANGPGVDPEHWDRWIRVRGQEYAAPANRRPRGGDNSERGPSTEAADVGDELHTDGNRAKVGAEQIRRLANQDQPFFLAVGFTKPHLPFVAPKKYWDGYERESFQLPENLGVPTGYPEFARNRRAHELLAYNDIPNEGLPSDWPLELNQRLIHGYLSCVSYTDRNIGVLLDELERAEVADNTIVIVWSDHGWKLGDHASWVKHTNFECDTRVPLIVKYPKLETASGHTQALTELIDLYPTLCELCDLEKPAHLQGKSFVPVLKDPNADHREFAYSSYPHGGGNQRRGHFGHSIRTEKYRYTEWWQNGTDRKVAAVLTNIEQDPGETTAVEGESELKDRLSQQLRDYVLSVRKR